MTAVQTGWSRFDTVAAARGPLPAIIQGDQTASFAALHTSALALAAAMVARGVMAGDRVVLFAENTPMIAAAHAAIWRLGAIPVMVGSDAPDSHLVHALTLTGARLVICGTETAARAEAHGPFLLAGPGLPEGAADALPPLTATSDDPASIVFTSGSTGLPKGVMQTHATLLVCCDNLFALFGLSADDRLLCGVPWSHDYGWGQLHFTFFHGLTMVLPVMRGAIGVCEAIGRHRPTIFAGVPSLFGAMLLGVSTIRQTDTSSVRVITSTGSPMPAAVQTALHQAFPGAGLRLNYGLTETYRSASLPPEMALKHPGAAGLPVTGVRLRILRADGAPAAPGETGEVVHCGAGVFAGYYGNPGATAYSRRPDSENPGAFCVHTGDLGRIGEDGVLYLTGRTDRQIKTMGVRVSPDEVENLLYDSGAVEALAIASVPHEIMGEMIVCAYVAKDDIDAARQLKAHAREVLSQHMMPRQFRQVEALPRTASGKIDYPAVRALFMARS